MSDCRFVKFHGNADVDAGGKVRVRFRSVCQLISSDTHSQVHFAIYQSLH